MPTLLQKVFKEFGDQGADTLDRFITQIAYFTKEIIDSVNRVRQDSHDLLVKSALGVE
jgi:hypothetical protein